MIRFPFVLISVLILTACSSSKKNEGNSADILQPDASNQRLAITVNVDGNLHEWPEPLPGYSKETTLHFGVTNNKDFLFIAVACDEDRIQQKMLRTGMEIYISENGKKETLTGISFPLSSAKANRSSETNDDNAMQRQNAKDYKKIQSNELTQLRTFGLKKLADSTYPLSNENNVKVAYSWSGNNFFNIEYAIPLKELFTDIAAINNKNIQIGFKLNGFRNRENNRQESSYGSGARGGGMRGGGMRGGGMRGSGMRQNREGSQGMNNIGELAKDQSFWTKYTISSTGK